ncbi:MAG: CRISPR system precrRNA processing endoribonuclease RAMP protein Cas6 [Candidatus Binatia bacterium]
MATPDPDLLALRILPLRITLQAETLIQLPPYKGSTLRGGFGHAFKDAVCVVEHRECERCILRSRCAYPYVFDTVVPENAARLRKYPAAPHPFVLLPPLEEKRAYEPGERIGFALTLIGKGADYLPYFIYALARLGERYGLGRDRGRFSVDSVAWLSPEGAEGVIYEGREKILRNSFRPLTLKDLPLSDPGPEVTLNFLTPTRIVYGGALTQAPEFHVVVRALLRRLSNLAYFHCGSDLKLDFRGLIAEAEKVKTASSRLGWYDWERYSARQEARMKLGGFVGEITYAGGLEPFMAFLRLGELLHVGKGTSFGLGKYVIEGP